MEAQSPAPAPPLQDATNGPGPLICSFVGRDALLGLRRECHNFIAVGGPSLKLCPRHFSQRNSSDPEPEQPVIIAKEVDMPKPYRVTLTEDTSWLTIKIMGSSIYFREITTSSDFWKVNSKYFHNDFEKFSQFIKKTIGPEVSDGESDILSDIVYEGGEGITYEIGCVGPLGFIIKLTIPKEPDRMDQLEEEVSALKEEMKRLLEIIEDMKTRVKSPTRCLAAEEHDKGVKLINRITIFHQIPNDKGLTTEWITVKDANAFGHHNELGSYENWPYHALKMAYTIANPKEWGGWASVASALGGRTSNPRSLGFRQFWPRNYNIQSCVDNLKRSSDVNQAGAAGPYDFHIRPGASILSLQQKVEEGFEIELWQPEVPHHDGKPILHLENNGIRSHDSGY